jgi:hypothetical protein
VILVNGSHTTLSKSYVSADDGYDDDLLQWATTHRYGNKPG